MTVLTLTGGEAGGEAAERADESQRAAELLRRAPDPRRARRHERQRGRRDDRHDPGRDRRDPPDAPSTRTPSATSTRTTATSTARRWSPPAASRASSATRRRRPRSTSSRPASSPSTSSSSARSRSSRPTRRRSRSAATSTRSCCARPRATGARFSQARYVEPLEVVRDSDATSVAAAAGRRVSNSRSSCSMPADPRASSSPAPAARPAISILRAWRRAADAAGGRHRPVRRRPLPGRRDPARDPARAATTRASPTTCWRAAGASAIDVRRAHGRHRAAPAGAPARGIRRRRGARSCSPSEATLAVCLDKWALAERCHGRVRGAGDRRRRRRVRPGGRRAAGDRQAALGQRLARHPAARAPRRARGAGARRHAARAGAPARPGVLARRARARRRPRRRGRAARAAEGRLRASRSPGARCTTTRWTRFAREVAAADRADHASPTSRSRSDADGEPALLEVNAALPRHDAADRRRRRRHAAAGDRRGARRRRSPTARCRSRTSRWCASSRSASSPSTTSPTCSATRRRSPS